MQKRTQLVKILFLIKKSIYLLALLFMLQITGAVHASQAIMRPTRTLALYSQKIGPLHHFGKIRQQGHLTPFATIAKRSVHQESSSKTTKLHEAVKSQDIDAVREALSGESCDIYAVDEKGKTALDYAFENGDKEIRKLISDCDKATKERTNSETAQEGKKQNRIKGFLYLCSSKIKNIFGRFRRKS